MKKIINYEKNKKRFLTISAATVSVMLVVSIGIIGAAPFSVQQQGTERAPGQSVTSSNIVDGEVRNQDLADNAVTSDKIANGEVTSADIEDGTITSTDIAEGTIPTPTGGGTPEDNSVTSATIVDETIASEDIGDGQVTTSELANDAVTSANIVDGQVTSADIGDGEVGSADVADGSITSTDLAPDAIPPPTGGGTPADNSVTSATIVDGQVRSADIGDFQVTTQDLANRAVTRDKIASGAVQLTTVPVSRTFFDFPPGGQSNIIAPCPAGSIVTGGGFGMNPGIRIDASGPVGNGWSVAATNPTQSSLSFTATAICATITP